MLSTRQLMEKMIAFKPISDDLEAVNACVTFLHNYLSEHECFTAVENLDGRRILYAATRPGKVSRVLLNAHLDVVPADESLFTVTENDDWLAGRGTHDCLGNCAILAHSLIRLAGQDDVGVIFSTDEEIGGATTRAMVERGYRGRELVIIADGSGYALVTAQKGVLSLTLRAHGTGCHSAKPWEGENAIDKLIDGYHKIRSLFPPVQPPDEWHDTMAATTIHAGSVHNQVPGKAEMTVNIRTTEKTDQANLLERLKKVSGLEVEVSMQCPPVFCQPDQPALDKLRRHMQRSLAHAITVKRSNGATDARHFVDAGVPIAIIGVPGRDLHGNGEAVSAEGLRDYEEMLISFLQSK